MKFDDIPFLRFQYEVSYTVRNDLKFTKIKVEN